jgi:hypothetical protein
MTLSENIIAFTCLPRFSLVYSYLFWPWHLKQRSLSSKKGDLKATESFVSAFSFLLSDPDAELSDPEKTRRRRKFLIEADIILKTKKY